MVRKIFRTGHSYAVTLSKRALEKAGLKVGDTVGVEPEDGKIVIRPERKNTQLVFPLKSKPKLGSKIA